jgi:hypothetical protein
MSASLKIDTAPAMKAFRAYALETNRELSAELNRRMFYVCLRAFVLMPPREIQAAKARAKAYIEEMLNARQIKRLNAAQKSVGFGNRFSVNRITKKGVNVVRSIAAQNRAGKNVRAFIKRVEQTALRRVHLIAQARRIKRGQKALLPKEIKAQAQTGKSAFRKGVGSVRSGAAAQGRVKAAIVKVLDSLSKANIGRAFSQFGREAKVNRKGVVTRPETPPNSALAKIAGEYGVGFNAKSSVGVMGGLRANTAAAKPGLNPVVSFHLEGTIQADQVSKVNAKLAGAFQQALNDEKAQLEAKMAAKAQAIADKYSAR